MTISPPRGKPIPDTVEAWKHHAHLMADQVEQDRKLIRYLKQRVNKLEQALAKKERT